MRRRAMFLMLILIGIIAAINHAIADGSNRYYGIDVSQHQGYIDWDTVAGNIDFALIRCGFGGDYTQYDDSRWEYNVFSCERLGIPYGVYLYSYMETEDEALGEADHTLRLLSGHHPTLPVYLDLEDAKVAALSNAQIIQYANLWLSQIRSAGYQAGVYANYNWWTNRLGGLTLKSDYKWLAAWSSGYENIARGYAVWQYTNGATVPGISGSVDGDYCWDLGKWTPVVTPTPSPDPTPTPTPSPTPTPTPTPTPRPTTTPRPTPSSVLQLPVYLKKIEDAAFESSDVESVLIPESVTSVGSRAFANNPQLLSVTFYSRSVYLARDVFADCPNLIIYGYADTPVEWYAIAKRIAFVALGE